MPKTLEAVRNLAEKEAVDFRLPRNWETERVKVSGIAIDGYDTHERDDAIYYHRTSDGYVVDVSIADVGLFVRPDSRISEYASMLGFTHYLYDGIIPMLPERISHEVLSFNNRVESPAITVQISLDDEFNTTNVDILKSRITPICKTYSKVDRLLNPNDRSADASFMCGFMEIAIGLMDKRQLSGGKVSRSIDTTDGYTVIDHEQRRKMRNSEFIVEQFMILANQSVADYMLTNDIPAIFRNNPMCIDVGFMSAVRSLISGDLTSIESKKPTHGLSSYAVKALGHAALAVPAYTHSTSPLRRLADLMNQRNLVSFVDGSRIKHTRKRLDRVTTHLNELYEEYRHTYENARAVSSSLGGVSLNSCHIQLSNFPYSESEMTGENLMNSVKEVIERGFVTPKNIYDLTLNGLEHNGTWREIADFTMCKMTPETYDTMAVLDSAWCSKKIGKPSYFRITKCHKQHTCMLNFRLVSNGRLLEFQGVGLTETMAKQNAAADALRCLYQMQLN